MKVSGNNNTGLTEFILKYKTGADISSNNNPGLTDIIIKTITFKY